MSKAKYIAIAAVTIDGKIAKDSKHFSDWTSPEDKKFMRAFLNEYDVVVVGNNTYKTATKPLLKRNCIVFTSKVKSVLKKSDNLLYVNPGKVNIKRLIEKSKYRNVALLGGAQTYAYFLEKNLLDEIYLTIEPIVFGAGINLFSSKNFGNYKFKLASIKKLNKSGSLLLNYLKD